MRRHLKRPALVGYLILLVLLLVIVVDLQNTQSRLESEVVHRQEQTCAAYDQLESIIHQVIAATAEEQAREIEIEQPELREYLERRKARSEAFRARVNEMLNESRCPVTNGR